MISLKCPECGFFFSVELPDDITEKEEKEAKMCPCGEMMVEVPFTLENIPVFRGARRSDLKPCPFCGGEAEMKVSKHIPNGMDYTPRCKNTACCGRLTKKYTVEETAIYMWNRRDGDDI